MFCEKTVFFQATCESVFSALRYKQAVKSMLPFTSLVHYIRFEPLALKPTNEFLRKQKP